MSQLLFLCLLAIGIGVTGDCQDDGLLDIRAQVRMGRLSQARKMSLSALERQPNCRRTIALAFAEEFEHAVETDGDYWKRMRLAVMDEANGRLTARHDQSDCQEFIDPSEDPMKAWDVCCSLIPNDEKKSGALNPFESKPVRSTQNGCPVVDPCCEFSVGSMSHVRLPALHEPAVAVRVQLGNFQDDTVSVPRRLDFEQDGYLRLFDVSCILWPTGYLLTQCLADPRRCGLAEVQAALRHSRSYAMSKPVAVELGTGLGAPSIALSLYLQEGNFSDETPVVVATDIAPQALALSISNAHHNGAHLHWSELNHTSVASLRALKERYFSKEVDTLAPNPDGFAVVYGSSLQDIYLDSQDSSCQLWATLDTLLDSGNPHAAAVLAHVKSNPLVPPSDESFKLVRKIDGDTFGLKTRAGGSSDFEIFVFQRSKAPVQRQVAEEL